MVNQESPIPRGIEVLVKKAAVDPDFRQLLLERRAAAAGEIGLKLEPAEFAMINAVPAEQLETIIANTNVSEVTRAAFLGRAAAVMLAALGVSAAGCSGNEPSKGVRPDRVPATDGVRPDRTNTLGERPDLPPTKDPASDPPPQRPDRHDLSEGCRPRSTSEPPPAPTAPPETKSTDSKE